MIVRPHKLFQKRAAAILEHLKQVVLPRASVGMEARECRWAGAEGSVLGTW